MALAAATIDEIKALIGKEAGVASWVIVDQERIDRFAVATGDDQFIHVDPVRAAQTPFGGTIAHGLLTLSLVPVMAYEALPSPQPVRMAVNYGYNRIRFTAPVRAGKRVRARFKVLDIHEVEPGRWDRTTEVTVEIEGEARPALIAEMISVIYL